MVSFGRPWMYSSSGGIISLISVFQMGGTLCTKSVTPSRIQENFNVWDFKWVQEYQATLQAILYPKNFLYLFHRLTDEDMAVMDSLVSIVVSCIQLPQNVGGICPQEYKNSFWKLDVTLIWGALPQNVGWRHLLWAETSLHPDYPFKVQRYTCHAIILLLLPPSPSP